MINLNRLFQNWFDDPEISVSELLSFAGDTRGRVAAHNSSGAFDILLPELDTNLGAAGGATGDEATQLAVRKAAVAAKRTLLEQIKGLISRRAGRVSDTFGKGSPQYLEFFPQGITPYREMNETDVAGKLAVLIAAAHKYDPTMETEFKAQLTSWTSAQKAAGDQIASTSAADVTQDQALAALRITLMKIIFTAALTFVGQENMGPALFDQSRLENRSGGGSNDTPPAAPPK